MRIAAGYRFRSKRLHAFLHLTFLTPRDQEKKPKQNDKFKYLLYKLVRGIEYFSQGNVIITFMGLKEHWELFAGCSGEK